MKRIALLTLILGTALAIAPAAYAIVLSDGTKASSGSHGTNLSYTEYRALMLRGEALNEQYGPSIGTSQPTRTSSGGSSFDWSYVGIAAFGAMLLALGSVAVTRQRRPLSV